MRAALLSIGLEPPQHAHDAESVNSGDLHWKSRSCGHFVIHRQGVTDRVIKHQVFRRGPPAHSQSERFRPGEGPAVSLMVQHKGLFSCSLTAGHKAFLGRFRSQSSPPVYKTAALPIELRRRPTKGSGTLRSPLCGVLYRNDRPQVTPVADLETPSTRYSARARIPWPASTTVCHGNGEPAGFPSWPRGSKGTAHFITSTHPGLAS